MHMYSDWPNFPLYTRMHCTRGRAAAKGLLAGADTCRGRAMGAVAPPLADRLAKWGANVVGAWGLQ